MFAGMVMAAALFFTVGGIFMKLSEGLTKFWPTMIVFALFVIGAALQTLAMKREDLAVTYLWVVGLESILAFMFGVLLFSESCTPARIAGVVLIAGGIISFALSLLTRPCWLLDPVRRMLFGDIRSDGHRIRSVGRSRRLIQSTRARAPWRPSLKMR
jgi:multidrug transporter EmrE-like cation transporter